MAMQKRLLAAAAAIMMPATSFAAPVDLSGWIENGRPNNGAGTWTVQGSNNDSVLQSRNGNPTVFFDPTANSQGTSLAGRITVETTGDDDFIGFVLGYQNNEINSTNADFWLIDWKQGDQSPAVDGLALSHVSGDLTGTSGSSFGGWWNHVAPINEVQRASGLGSTGWNDNQEYIFDIVFTSSLIEVKVDGQTELSYAGNFTDGSFGFYNFSQAQVRYAGITQDVVPTTVPLPAALPLLAGGLGILGLAGWRRRNSI